MPWTAEYFEDGAEIRYHGVLTGAEILRAKQEFFTHPFASKAKWVLCDFSAVEQFSLARNDVEQIISQDLRNGALNPALAECVVAIRPYEYGMARMWEIQVERAGRNTMVGRSRAEAERWLGEQGLGRR